MEQKYQIGNEHGCIMWDIEKMLEDKHKFEIREYDVEDLAKHNPFHGREEHIMNTDFTKPLIVVCLKENVYKLIDGNHRLQKALHFHIPRIKAYTLAFEEHREYIVDYNEKIYFEVVAHWQS